jgi:hypothetical protein
MCVSGQVKNFLSSKSKEQLERDAIEWAKTNQPRLYQKLINTDGVMSVKVVIGLIVSLYVLANLLPGAITAIIGANTTGWGPGNIALWGLLPLLVIIVIVMKYYED